MIVYDLITKVTIEIFAKDICMQKLRLIEKFKMNENYYSTILAFIGAIVSLCINFKHYEWILKIFFDVSSNVFGIMFVGVFYIAIIILLILYLSFFAIVGYYFTKLLFKLLLNIIE